MDVVYTFQTSQTAVPGALRRQPSVVSQHNDAKTVSSPTHVGLSPSTAMALPAPASSSTAGSEWLLTHKPNCFCTSNQSTITTFFLTSLSNCLSLSLSLRSPNACARSLSLSLMWAFGFLWYSRTKAYLWNLALSIDYALKFGWRDFSQIPFSFLNFMPGWNTLLWQSTFQILILLFNTVKKSVLDVKFKEAL